MQRAHLAFHITALSPKLVKRYGDEIIRALDQIPQVDPHTREDLYAEGKNGRIYHEKWRHSFVALDEEDAFLGIIIGYEREAEENNQYPIPSLYINSLAVAKDHQGKGVAKALLQHWLSDGKKQGFHLLSGKVSFCVQTNRAPWNAHVQKLYESVGFMDGGEKEYSNRTNTLYRLIP